MPSLIIVDFFSAASWSYEGANGPSAWKNDYPICNQQAQSPIDLPPIASMEYDKTLEPFTLDHFDHPGTMYNLTMKNNMHTGQWVAVL